ncbi:unnamed protein product, partial [Prorocentrum cordatum]
VRSSWLRTRTTWPLSSSSSSSSSSSGSSRRLCSRRPRCRKRSHSISSCPRSRWRIRTSQPCSSSST